MLSPGEDFGPFLQPLIALAVGVILFEGGLTLNFRELRGISRGVRQLVLVGAPVAWVLNALAAHYVAGLAWPVAILFGAVLIVTGPTVIIPLLRQAKLCQRPAAVLNRQRPPLHRHHRAPRPPGPRAQRGVRGSIRRHHQPLHPGVRVRFLRPGR